jgi:Uma2 family endonuclease
MRFEVGNMQHLDNKIQSTNSQFVYETTENGAPDSSVKVHAWTRDEYYRMAEIGFFEKKKVELIEGEIIEMSPMKTLHATVLRIILEVMRNVFEDDFVVDSQLPISFGKNSEPEPDIAIVKGNIKDFAKSHPKTAALIIEVSDSTLRYDRSVKARLYAKNKIQEYWIVNLNDRVLEVFRRPIKDKNLGYIYSEVLILTDSGAVSPLAAPKRKIKIADILP